MDGVAARVHGGPAGQVQLVADVRETGEGEAQRRLDPLDGAQLTARDDLHRPLGHGVIAVVEGLHHDQPRTLGFGRHHFGLGCVGGERLLAEHVFACGDGFAGPLGVQSVREGVVDGVDSRVVDHRLVGGGHAWHPVLGREGFGSGPVPGGHDHHLGLGVTAGRADDSVGGDAGRPENADSYRAHACGAHGGGATSIGASCDGGILNRSRRWVQSSCAAVISSWVRAT